MFINFFYFQKLAENLLKLVVDSKNTIFTLHTIKELYSNKLGINEDLKTIKLLVHWLEMNGKACVYFENKHCHAHLIKFKTENHISPQISETEISIFILQKKEQSLMESLQTLENEKEILQAEVKNYLKQKMRVMVIALPLNL